MSFSYYVLGSIEKMIRISAQQITNLSIIIRFESIC